MQSRSISFLFTVDFLYFFAYLPLNTCNPETITISEDIENKRLIANNIVIIKICLFLLYGKPLIDVQFPSLQSINPSAQISTGIICRSD